MNRAFLFAGYFTFIAFGNKGILRFTANGSK